MQLMCRGHLARVYRRRLACGLSGKREGKMPSVHAGETSATRTTTKSRYSVIVVSSLISHSCFVIRIFLRVLIPNCELSSLSTFFARHIIPADSHLRRAAKVFAHCG